MNLKLFPAVVYRLVSTYNADPNTEYGSTTPLMRAIQYGYFPTVATLVSLGADVNKEGKVAAYYRNQTYWTSTPLHEATSSPECIAYLLAHGARIDAQDGFRRTPLHGAAGWETPSSLACLLAQGASVNVRDEDGDTPLHLAARTQFTDTRSVPKVAMLLAHGAEPRLRNNKGQTALDLVEHRNTDDPDIAEIKRLLEEHESAKQPREHEAKRARRS